MCASVAHADQYDRYEQRLKTLITNAIEDPRDRMCLEQARMGITQLGRSAVAVQRGLNRDAAVSYMVTAVRILESGKCGRRF